MLTLEETILGILIQQPELLAYVDISVEFFISKRKRQVFREIEKGKTNASLIAEKIGGDDAFSYISRLREGIPKSNPENLNIYVNEVRRKRKEKEILQKIHRQERAGNINLTEFRKDFEELDSFNSVTPFKAESLKEFRRRKIPETEVIVRFHAVKEQVSILAGIHKRGKSLYSIQMGLCAAAGRDFLDFSVPKPQKVLLLQQEISEASMKERIDLMMSNYDSPLVEENFIIKNTIGNLIKVTNASHRIQLYREIERCEPALIIFDPYSTFHNYKENDQKEMSAVMDFFYEVAQKFKVGVFLIHHYGKPSLAQRKGGHQLRGHSVLGDRPDMIILFNELPSKYQRSPLPNPPDHYAELEFILRSNAKPGNYIIERNPENLWYRVYDLYGQLGRKILPEYVRNIICENGGEMFQTKLVNILLEKASRAVIFNAIREAKYKDYIKADVIPGKPGNPVLLKLKEKENT